MHTLSFCCLLLPSLHSVYTLCCLSLVTRSRCDDDDLIVVSRSALQQMFRASRKTFVLNSSLRSCPSHDSLGACQQAIDMNTYTGTYIYSACSNNTNLYTNHASPSTANYYIYTLTLKHACHACLCCCVYGPAPLGFNGMSLE